MALNSRASSALPPDRLSPNDLNGIVANYEKTYPVSLGHLRRRNGSVVLHDRSQGACCHDHHDAHGFIGYPNADKHQHDDHSPDLGRLLGYGLDSYGKMETGLVQ